MPDLSYDGAMEWLKMRDPIAAAVALPGHVDAVEQAADLIVHLGSLLDDALAGDKATVADLLSRPELQTLMTQIGLARRLRLLEWVREVDLPNWQGIQDHLADPLEMAGLERLEILQSIFSPERLAALRGICERVKGGAA